MKKNTLVAISLLLNFNLFAQFKPTAITDLEESYTNYFKLNRELVFLHLNKTEVIKSENLWLSAYVYNATLNSPNQQTVNLNLEIFDDAGDFIESKTVLIAGGKGGGYLDLNKDIYPEGKYFIKASTQYMKNFKEDLSFVQSFEILGSSIKNDNVKEKSFDLQLLPEGGHLLTDVWNTIGVKLIDSNGNSVVFTEAKLLDSEMKLISTFNSNQFGLSKFTFLPRSKGDYRVEVSTIDGEKVSAALPKAEQRGFNIIANNLDEQFIFKVNTNKESKDLVEDKVFYAAIHKDGNIKDFTFQFPKNKLEASLKISKDSLYSGINTITIFDEDFNPLLERLFFNDKNLRRIRVNAQVNGVASDSVRINLNSEGLIKNNSLSISVLPGTTKAYNPKHNILSAFYLKPYINGDLVNGEYYFSDTSSRKLQYDLDLLLITQGWSKFNWTSIYNDPPKELMIAERGFTIEGEISGRNDKKENTMFVKSEETGLFEVVEVNDDDSFILKNIYILDSTALSYGLINDRKGRITKPSIYANITPNKTQSSLELENKYKYLNTTIETRSNFNEFIIDAQVLDTVNLKGYILEFEVPREAVRANDIYVEVTDKVYQRYMYVTDYISQHGFMVYYNDFGELFIKNKIPFSMDAELNTPLIYWNGFPNGSPRQLEYLMMEDLESITISKLGIGYGMRAGGGVIKIVTRTKNRVVNSHETISEIITSNGFAKEKKFYAPKYSSYSNETYSDFGVIDWISDLSIEQNGNVSFKISNTNQSQISLFIEGITVDGNLISENIKIQTR
ncbi:hypothetical protein BC962_1071 [Gillisia mitskevichiae]|uniref:MG2 domain-containing protein n=1 Tax=Gillisia mitskevichiae TaxID=270921 RepID=A0A495PZW5_9FLAO|nr:hypothetical protein [Gillisia mitskevichiae]RKS56092.1 hypothetical protein BC962_1071 [Gillisia mitskevichiae]